MEINSVTHTQFQKDNSALHLRVVKLQGQMGLSKVLRNQGNEKRKPYEHSQSIIRAFFLLNSNPQLSFHQLGQGAVHPGELANFVLTRQEFPVLSPLNPNKLLSFFLEFLPSAQAHPLQRGKHPKHQSLYS